MSFLDLIWIFIVIAAVQPIVRKRWLESQRTHDYPITVDEAQNLGLRVEADVGGPLPRPAPARGGEPAPPPSGRGRG
jgi:hypothetical protein